MKICFRKEKQCLYPLGCMCSIACGLSFVGWKKDLGHLKNAFSSFCTQG
jgi:hypothetical protein